MFYRRFRRFGILTKKRLAIYVSSGLFQRFPSFTLLLSIYSRYLNLREMLDMNSQHL
ncbi:hypothetical protein BX600DRAFT_450263, partial [Xylariales sp. PMI_506]